MKRAGQSGSLSETARTSQQTSTTSLNIQSSSAAGQELTSQDLAKSSSVGFSQTNGDSIIALELFPEFLSQDTHRSERLLFNTSSEERRFKGLLNLNIVGRNQTHMKPCEDIVQWIKTEYGIAGGPEPV